MALQNLRTYYQSSNINDFVSLLDIPCVVSEKIQASSFHVKRTKTGFEYFKSGSKNSMDRVDRTMVKYYESGIKYFSTILKELTEDMPLDWKFGFDYMLDNKTVDIEYDALPKNHLILTHIQILKPNDLTQVKKVIRDLGKDKAAAIKKFDKEDVAKKYKENIRPFEDLFLELGSVILKNASNFVAANPAAEMQRLHTQIRTEADKVKKGGDVKQIEKVISELERLERIGGIESIIPTEGIVFIYKGKTMKLTGTFAAINQLMGIIKYGR